MEYLESDTRLGIDSEALATPNFAVYTDSIPTDVRPRIIDNITRAWGWAGFGIYLQ